MKLLCIETSTEACSAALYDDGNILHVEQFAPRRHAELVLGMCEQLLNQAGCSIKQLDAIGFGRGPGAFTGVRVAVGVAQGLAWSAGLPVVPVSTLAALAQGAVRAHQAQRVIAAIDARMGEVYAATYTLGASGCVVQADAERVCKADAFVITDTDTDWFGCGTGWATYAEDLQRASAGRVVACDDQALPLARDVAPLAAESFTAGAVLDAAHALPVYLRDNVAEKSSKQS